MTRSHYAEQLAAITEAVTAIEDKLGITRQHVADHLTEHAAIVAAATGQAPPVPSTDTGPVVGSLGPS